MSAPYDVVHLDGLDRIAIGETGLEWRPIRRRLGIRAFGTNAYSSSRVGGEIVLMHVGSAQDRSTIDAQALPGVIRAIRARGYRFVTLRDVRGPR